MFLAAVHMAHILGKNLVFQQCSCVITPVKLNAYCSVVPCDPNLCGLGSV